MRSLARRPRSRARARVPTPAREDGFAARGGLRSSLAVVAIACWAAPLARQLGADGRSTALTVALPLTLALQWCLRSRYLGRPHGLANLGRAAVACSRAVAVALAGRARRRARS